MEKEDHKKLKLFIKKELHKMGSKNLSIPMVANIIEFFYYSDFAGKVKGRIRISRKDLLQILGRERLHFIDYQNLVDELLSRSILFFGKDDVFYAIRVKTADSWRKVTQGMLSTFSL
jgi:hypothetical protein